MLVWVVALLAAPLSLYLRTRTPAPWALGLLLYVAVLVTGVELFKAWGAASTLHALFAVPAFVVVAGLHGRLVLGYSRWCRGIVVLRR